MGNISIEVKQSDLSDYSKDSALIKFGNTIRRHYKGGISIQEVVILWKRVTNFDFKCRRDVQILLGDGVIFTKEKDIHSDSKIIRLDIGEFQ